MSYNIYISPSNQSANLYATGGTNEQVECDKIAMATATHLKRCGFNVKVGKSSTSTESRCRESDSFKADLHIAEHTNATSKHNVTGGTLVMVYKNDSEHNKAGQYILDAVGKISPGNDYAIQYRQDLYELRVPKALSVYLEVEFHDTKTGSDWIRKNIDKIGEETARGVCKYFGVKYIPAKTDTPAKPTTTTKEKTVYRVVAGSFSGEDGAKIRVKELEKAGFKGAWIDKVKTI